MPSNQPDGLFETLLELNRLMVAEEGLDSTLQRVVDLACRTVPGCSTSGITVERGGQPLTPAFAGEGALGIDSAQYESGRGPCLEAFRERHAVWVTAIEDENQAGRWPEFQQAALSRGIHSSLTLPLEVSDEPMGALNLYGASQAAFDAEAKELATLFSRQAAVAISNSAVYWRTVELTQNLKTALESRDLIGQAKGVLMHARRITADEAFDLLRQSSQHLNRKLAEVAAEVAFTGELPDRADQDDGLTGFRREPHR